ncbi:MAG: hypothetical protein D6706_11910 [Chloroflexi bacterium]|nr:MAG: hypothetical protein D6706_11910 [Chloroflexota bacterium]
MRRYFIALTLFLMMAMPNVASADGPIVGEIRLWAGLGQDHLPPGWVIAEGQCVSRLQYSELFSVIGTSFGDCGPTAFKLPDLRGRVPVGFDQTDPDFVVVGKTGGEKTHTLTIDEMPSHSHKLDYYRLGTVNAPNAVAYPYGYGTDWGGIGTSSTGGNQPHNNLQPYLTLNYIIYIGGASAPTPTPTSTFTPTPTSTPISTATPMPTPTEAGVTSTAAYTFTLDSGNVIAVYEEATFGEIITSSVLLSILCSFCIAFYLPGSV